MNFFAVYGILQQLEVGGKVCGCIQDVFVAIFSQKCLKLYGVGKGTSIKKFQSRENF